MSCDDGTDGMIIVGQRENFLIYVSTATIQARQDDSRDRSDFVWTVWHFVRHLFDRRSYEIDCDVFGFVAG